MWCVCVCYARALQSLNLPAALEALEKPIGLPPSLLSKAQEVRIEDGPGRIEIMIEDVQKLARRDMNIIDEVREFSRPILDLLLSRRIQALDILDQEADEDEDFRNEHSSNRVPSQIANAGFIEKAQKYRAILQRAAESDEIVRHKWEEWESNIVELTWDEVTSFSCKDASRTNVLHRIA